MIESERRGSSTDRAFHSHPEPTMSVLDLVQQNLGPAEIQQLSEQLGADPSSTASAVQAALPMLLGGMASSARSRGAPSL